MRRLRAQLLALIVGSTLACSERLADGDEVPTYEVCINGTVEAWIGDEPGSIVVLDSEDSMCRCVTAEEAAWESIYRREQLNEEAFLICKELVEDAGYTLADSNCEERRDELFWAYKFGGSPNGPYAEPSECQVDANDGC